MSGLIVRQLLPSLIFFNYPMLPIIPAGGACGFTNIQVDLPQGGDYHIGRPGHGLTNILEKWIFKK